MSTGLISIGAVTLLVPTAYSGFAYQGHKQVVPILGTGTSAGNSVLQQSALGYREASLTLGAMSIDDLDTLRAYDETSEAVDMTDDDGTREVRVLSFASTLAGAGLWNVSLTLQELSDPVPVGS